MEPALTLEAARKRIQRPRKGPRGKSKIDWKAIDQYARDGLFESIPPEIFIRYRKNIEMIRSDTIRRSQQAQLLAPPLFADIVLTKELSKGNADILIPNPNIENVP